MSTTQTMTRTDEGRGLLSKALVFAYALLSYAVGMASIAWLAACCAGAVPFGMGPLNVSSAGAALGVNVGLIGLFALQHSVMARKRFKDWWTRYVPPAAERSTYVLTAGLMLSLVLWLWQPIDGIVWSVTSEPARVALWGLFAFGWLYLVASTFATNHFDLFGLRQAWLHLREAPYTSVPFTRRWMYNYSRHPMMAGILLGLWATPSMGLSHLVLAIGMSAYIAIGIRFEERALARALGEPYRQYCREVGVLWPKVRERGPAT